MERWLKQNTADDRRRRPRLSLQNNLLRSPPTDGHPFRQSTCAQITLTPLGIVKNDADIRPVHESTTKNVTDKFPLKNPLRRILLDPWKSICVATKEKTKRVYRRYPVLLIGSHTVTALQSSSFSRTNKLTCCDLSGAARAENKLLRLPF